MEKTAKRVIVITYTDDDTTENFSLNTYGKGGNRFETMGMLHHALTMLQAADHARMTTKIISDGLSAKAKE